MSRLSLIKAAAAFRAGVGPGVSRDVHIPEERAGSGPRVRGHPRTAGA